MRLNNFLFFISFLSFESFFYTSKSPKVPRTLFSILADLTDALVCIVSTRPLIPIFAIPRTSSLMTLPSAPVTIGITVIFIFHVFFSILSQCLGIISVFTFPQFYPVVRLNCNFIIRQFLFFY